MGITPAKSGRTIERPREFDIAANDILISSEFATKLGLLDGQRLLVLEASKVDITNPPCESINLQLSIAARPISETGQIDLDGGQKNFYIPMENGYEISNSPIPFVMSVTKIGNLRGS